MARRPAATLMLHRVKRWSGLKAWATRVAKLQETKSATVALARKMAVVMHRMWVDGTKFRPGKSAVAAAACRHGAVEWSAAGHLLPPREAMQLWLIAPKFKELVL